MLYVHFEACIYAFNISSLKPGSNSHKVRTDTTSDGNTTESFHREEAFSLDFLGLV